jgi:hypothetical protein
MGEDYVFLIAELAGDWLWWQELGIRRCFTTELNSST